MSEYIGVDPEYRNHAYDTDKPLAAEEDGTLQELEQRQKDYQAEMKVANPAPFATTDRAPKEAPAAAEQAPEPAEPEDEDDETEQSGGYTGFTPPSS